MVGAIAYENRHPFSLQDATGRAWTLIHNGTLFHAPQLNSYSARQRGETDSERALIRLVVKINEATQARGDALLPDERFQVVETFVAALSQGNKFNLLIYDGEFLYAHMNYADSLHYKEIDGGLIFATQPLDSGGAWKRMPLTTLRVYREGTLVYEGKKHGNIFVDNADDMRRLFLDFAVL